MAVVVLRATIFYIIIVVSLRLMGKRQIGELEPTELGVTIMISELSTLTLQDINIPIIYAIIAIAVIIALEVLFSVLSLKSRAFSTALSGRYSVIIDNGKLNIDEMAKAQITADELLEEVRLHGALDITEVRFCILETSGKMSVILGSDTDKTEIPVPIVIDGKPVKNNLQKLNISDKELSSLLKKNGYASEKEVFWMTYTKGGITAVGR